MEPIASDTPILFHACEPVHGILGAALAPCIAGYVETRKRAAKRPTISALIKAAQAAGLKVTAIESSDCGVKLFVGEQAGTDGDEEGARLDRLMVEQMGVARMGGRPGR